MNTKRLYCDGTIFEAHNSRHKIITEENLKRSNTKWTNILNSEKSSIDQKTLATSKLALNVERSITLEKTGRKSYGRTDKDSIIVKDKNGSFVAGYNVQFVEESNHGLIVFTFISNESIDMSAFKRLYPLLLEKIKPEEIVLDTCYGSPENIHALNKLGVNLIVKAVKNKDDKPTFSEMNFELSDDYKYLICSNGRKLYKTSSKKNDVTSFKSSDCSNCISKEHCCPKTTVRRVDLNIDHYLALKKADELVKSKDGIEAYKHRGNLCESPNGYIKYYLKGKKFTMNGLDRNNVIVKIYAILYNLRRLISIKNASREN